MSPLLAVANVTAMAEASHFHGGVRCNQEVEDHDPEWQGKRAIVVPVDDEVVVVVAITVGIGGGGGGGGGGAMRLLVLKEEPQEGRKRTRNR